MPKKFFDIIPPKGIEPPLKKLEVHPVKSSLRRGAKGKPKKKVFLKTLIFCLAILVPLGVVGFFFFSKVEIEIWPETDILSFKETVTIDLNAEDVNFEAKIIPGKVFSDQKFASQEFPASGKILKEEKAAGVIRVYNNYHLTQILVVNTRFQPPLESFLSPLDEKKGEMPWFRTLNRIVIPSKSYKEVRVIADSPGEKYNIKPTKFSIPGLSGGSRYTFVYGESFEEFRGGFRHEVPQITEGDLEKAENVLAEKLKRESRDSLKSALPSDFVLLDETISQEIVETNSSAEAGTEAESFNFQVKVKSEGLGFKKSDIENFAKNCISLDISEGKKIQEESLEINYFPESIDLGSGKIVLNLEIKAKIYSDIDLAELKKALLGKSLKETKIFLESLPRVTKVEIKSWPFLKKKIPENIEKVEIKLNLD